MEFFVEIVDEEEPLTTVERSSIIDIFLGPNYASALQLIISLYSFYTRRRLPWKILFD